MLDGGLIPGTILEGWTILERTHSRLDDPWMASFYSDRSLNGGLIPWTAASFYSERWNGGLILFWTLDGGLIHILYAERRSQSKGTIIEWRPHSLSSLILFWTLDDPWTAASFLGRRPLERRPLERRLHSILNAGRIPWTAAPWTAALFYSELDAGRLLNGGLSFPNTKLQKKANDFQIN